MAVKITKEERKLMEAYSALKGLELCERYLQKYSGVRVGAKYKYIPSHECHSVYDEIQDTLGMSVGEMEKRCEGLLGYFGEKK